MLCLVFGAFFQLENHEKATVIFVTINGLRNALLMHNRASNSNIRRKFTNGQWSP